MRGGAYPGLRVGFSQITEDQLAEAITRLGRAMRAAAGMSR